MKLTGKDYIIMQLLASGTINEAEAAKMRAGEMQEAIASDVYTEQREQYLFKKYSKDGLGLVLQNGLTTADCIKKNEGVANPQCLQNGNAVFKNQKTYIAEGKNKAASPFGLIVNYN